MSGLEIVGVVLAVVPICVTVITAYNKTEKAVIRFREAAFTLEEYVRQLRRHGISLRLTVKELLMEGSELSRPDIDQMIKDPRDTRWKDAKLRDRLHNRYPNFYPEFETYVNETLERLKKLLRLLGVCKTQHLTLHELDKILANRTDHSRWRFRDGVNLARHRADIIELFAALERCQTTIDAIKTKDKRISQLEHINSNSAEEPFQVLRQYARALHVALTKLLHCDGHPKHQVGMQIESQSGPRPKSDSQVGTSSSYQRIKLIFGQSEGWQRGEAHICEHVRMLPSTINPLQGTQVKVEDSLCPILVRHSNPTDFVGFHINPRNEGKVRGVYREFDHTQTREAGSQSTGMTSSTLGSLLIESDQPQRQFGFSVRMAAAALLASAVRRLHTTNWLSNSLGSSDVVFVGRLPQQCADLSRMSLPFFVQNFFTCGENECQQRWSDLPRYSRNAMRKIGIILMELYFGETIEHFEHAAMSVPAPGSDRERLEVWLRQRCYKIPEKYLAAVEACNVLDLQSDALAAHALSEMESNLTNMYESGRQSQN